jgi:hypothetical protein
MTAIEIVQLLDLVVSIAIRSGISVAQFHAMREASGGNLTKEQVEELAKAARVKVADL